MTTQRDRLAGHKPNETSGFSQRDRLEALLFDLNLSDGYIYSDGEAADALLAHGVRIVNAETLATALVVAGLPGLPGEAERILAALDGEADR